MKIVRDKNPALFFSKKEKQAIEAAVATAELKTSGEIRVHLQRRAREPFFEHAKEIFEKIGMTHTKERNGVLIFIGLASQRFAILGDDGINQQVPEGFWDGIVHAVLEIGEQLQTYFPHQRDDVNELPDAISCSY